MLLLSFYYLMNCIMFIGVPQSSQPNVTACPSQTLSASPIPQPVSFGNHKFFKVCELVSVLQGSSLCPFFQIFFFFGLFVFSRATPSACGGSQARGLIGAAAASLHHSHSNSGSEPRLQPTPQLTAILDHQPSEQGQGSNPQPHGS